MHYSRAHEWRFDGGVRVAASSSPHLVPLPWSNADNVDPEEAYVAALSSCHMLTFLWLAAKEGYIVDRYVDDASGTMNSIGNGRQAVTHVLLKPELTFSGDKRPSDDAVAQLHHHAHEECYLANSVKTQIDVQGSWHYASKPVLEQAANQLGDAVAQRPPLPGL
jgi:organic hydroperoxide reductase OsmC/OhrA